MLKNRPQHRTLCFWLIEGGIRRIARPGDGRMATTCVFLSKVRTVLKFSTDVNHYQRPPILAISLLTIVGLIIPGAVQSETRPLVQRCVETGIQSGDPPPWASNGKWKPMETRKEISSCAHLDPGYTKCSCKTVPATKTCRKPLPPWKCDPSDMIWQ